MFYEIQSFHKYIIISINEFFMRCINNLNKCINNKAIRLASAADIPQCHM